MSASRLILKRVATGAETELGGKELTVGRSAESGLVLAQASRKHARITTADGAAWVEDVGSTNGTFVNDRKITARTRLSSGDRVRFDLEEFEFRVIQPDPPVDDRTLPRGVASNPVEKEKRPGAWADPNAAQVGGSKTMLVGSEEMRNKLREEKARFASTAEPRRVQVPSLLVTSGSREHAVIPLRASGAKGEWTIGSDADRDIVLADSGVSGVHALLINEGNRWQLKDQLSANGTFVNGKRINMSYLSSGDSLRFGPVQCTFQLPERAARAASGPGHNRFALIGGISFAVTLVIVLVLWWWLMHSAR
jgi:pSer/pThr/pTyr-binding forkhead associated (FHA) protein